MLISTSCSKKMDKDRFEYAWKMSLLIAVIAGMIILIGQFARLDREGLECRSNPFIWGAQEMSGKFSNSPVGCSCFYLQNGRPAEFGFTQDGYIIRPKDSFMAGYQVAGAES